MLTLNFYYIYGSKHF